MSPRHDSNDLPRIAAEATWVRRLAVALARDVHAGEDIAQDALLAASRGHRIGDLRAWLAGTVRNLARLRHRGDERRAARELHGARSERVDDPTLAFERLELQEALLGAVRELSEPYRTSVLLRWFEGLEPEEIAQRTNTPVRTVHTRLQRALGLLRERLDRRSQGDRSRWLAAWLPALAKSSSGWKWLLLMELKTKLAIAGIALLAALAGTSLLVLSRPAQVDEPKKMLATRSAREPVVPSTTHAAVLEGVTSEPVQLEPALQVRTREQAAGCESSVLHGHVIDVSGANVPGVELVFRAANAPPGATGAKTTSDRAGRFELAPGAERGKIELATSDWVLVHTPEIPTSDPQADCVLLLGKPRSIEGLVVDPSGKPLPDVTVLALDPLISNELGGSLQDLPPGTLSIWSGLLNAHPVTTNAQGQFWLSGLVAQGYRLLAKNDRTLERAVSEPLLSGSTDVLIVLGEPSGLCSFAGRVVDLQGKPIPRANVAPMRTVARRARGSPVRIDTGGVLTDEEGRFEISDKSCELEGFIVWPESNAPARILSIAPGADRGALLLRVGHITHVQVQLRTPNLTADTAEFLDAAGVECGTGIKIGQGWIGGGSMSLSSGASDVRMISEEATTLVLLLQGKEVSRLPIHLDPATVNVLNP